MAETLTTIPVLEQCSSKKKRCRKEEEEVQYPTTQFDDLLLLERGGGFLSLEEIDECNFDFAAEIVSEGGVVVKKKKKKKPKKKKPNNAQVSGDVGYKHSNSSTISSLDVSQVLEDESYKSQFYAWDELRLHPLIMKSIYDLGFKEPTPIQKACIAAAAHRGQDVIGAAETGSGKTLAFGIPILQRLLEEREKVKRSFFPEGNAVEQEVRESPLRALILVPTIDLAIQVTTHLNEVAKYTNIKVVPIVGKISSKKQERLLKSKPEIIVGTAGRLSDWISGGDDHLSELQSLSFFVLDEADQMIKKGQFHELPSIIERLPMSSASAEANTEVRSDCITVSNIQEKKRQTLVFSATLALSADFRKKLQRRHSQVGKSMNAGDVSSLETLSEVAGIRADAAIVDLTSNSIVASKLEESFIECREEDKDAYLYYILSVHGQGRTIVFCTSISAARRIHSLLRILGINAGSCHSAMKQRAHLKAMDHFRENEHAVLIAADGAARGLDIPGVRTVIHYQLPHSADVYVHRSGRTARASADGCCIALISPTDSSKFASLCRSFSKENYQAFPLDHSYMPECKKRLSLACQIDKILRKDTQEKAKESCFKRNATSLELVLEDNDSEEERVNNCKQKKRTSLQLRKLQQELDRLLSCPLQPNTFSNRFLAGSGVSPSLQYQLEEIAKQKAGEDNLKGNKKIKVVVIGQDSIEPLEALRNAKLQGRVSVKKRPGKQRSIENLKRKRKQEKQGLHDRRRKQKKAVRLEKNSGRDEG